MKKSTIREGFGINGTWRIMRFWVERQYNHKKIMICFTAKGKLAEYIYRMDLGKKLDVDFFPDCVSLHNPNGDDKVYTELIATHIEVHKTKAEKYFEENITPPVNTSYEFDDDMKLLKQQNKK